MSVNCKTIGELDSYLFFEGTHTQSYCFMGAHETADGWDFVVWAPNAQGVSIIGDFNDWTAGCTVMKKVHDNGLWLCNVKCAKAGDRYRYAIETLTGNIVEKIDPYARACCPDASVLMAENTFRWQDAAWLDARKAADHRRSPISVYEVVPCTWKRNASGDMPNYRQLADALCEHVLKMGYTHVALTPQCEHAPGDVLGVHPTSYFCVDHTLGSANDLRYFVDLMHQNGIGVMMDFMPAKFVKNALGLSLFDGSPCYEPLFTANTQGVDMEGIFHYGRNEVRSFLSSAANFWACEFHVDALRICNVSNMLYRNFDRSMAQYIRSESENSEGIALLRFINDSLHKQHPGFICIAQEETTWPLVTAPPYAGGLGFDYKWNLGWVSDTLQFMQDDPVYHPYHHNALTFSMMYAFSENFVLPLSHEQMTGGRHTYLSKMPGSYVSQAAQVRLLLGYQYTHPGKKLNFMGTEIGMQGNWNICDALQWDRANEKLCAYVKELNRLYKQNDALYACDDSWDGYRWINANDADRSVLSYMRMSRSQTLIVLCNFSPVKWNNYRVALPHSLDASIGKEEHLSVILNSDASAFGGSGAEINLRPNVSAAANSSFGFSIDLPAFSTIILAYN